MLLFLHISDIHFCKWSGTTYDADDDLRNEIEIDAKKFSKTAESPDGILVSGDIAFSGSREEYAIAKEWLKTLCDKVGCSHDNVWCVPGNHDVNQQIARKSKTLTKIQEDLRQTAKDRPHALNGELLELMSDPIAFRPLYQPLEDYNDFAATFKCEINPEKPIWRQSFTLNDGSSLRLNGLTSTTVSNHFDNDHKFVIIGEHQLPKREEGIVDFVMCHHPHDWLQGADVFKNTLNKRTQIQLFGHKHMQAVRQIDNSLHIVAGAVHPDRRELQWEPRYNWLKVSTDVDDTGRKLKVSIYPRIWSQDNSAFGPDFNSCSNNDHKDYSFSLPSWTPSSTTNEEPDIDRNIQVQCEPGGANMNWSRVLTYRFLDLSHLQIIDIARHLNLLQDDDEGVRDLVLYQRIFERAIEEGQLDKLWNEIEKKHNDSKYPTNPFADNQDA